MSRRHSKSLGCALAILCAGLAHAQGPGYPTKPIRMLNPLAAGGPTDILARMFAQPLSESLGRQVIVDNRPGASGNIAAEMAAKAPPDGYTLFIAGAGNLAINVSLFSKIPYDPVKDFAPVAMLATAPYLIAVHPSVNANSTKELITLAKAKPGLLNYGAVTGNGAHLATELFKTAAGIEMVHIPYKGAVLATSDVISGSIQVTFASTPGAMPHVKTGKLKALSITSAKRATALPDLPTVAQTGLGQVNVAMWFGVFGPKGLPAELVTSLNQEINQILASDDVKTAFSTQGMDPAMGTPAEFARLVERDAEKWTRLVKDQGIKPE